MRVSNDPWGIEAAVETFSSALIRGGPDGLDVAASMLANLPALDAVRLVLAASVRFDSVIGDSEVVELAEFLGVYAEEDV